MTICMFFLFSGLLISGVKNMAHSASCPANEAYAGIKTWHYLQSTAGPYTQTTEYEGTVSIQFLYLPKFYIQVVGNNLISKTIDAKTESPYWNCTYETAQAEVSVQISTNSETCTDGTLFMKIIEEAEETSAQYHCVDADGNVYGPFTQVYPATKLEHDIIIEYVHEAMVILPFPEGTGDYSWTLLFRDSPTDAVNLIPILKLLMFD